MLALLANGAAAAAPPSSALAQLFAEHHGFVWRSLSLLSVGSADLDDALQEVFVVVHRRWGDYQEQQKIRAWLYAICVRVALDLDRAASAPRAAATRVAPERVATSIHARRLTI